MAGTDNYNDGSSTCQDAWAVGDNTGRMWQEGDGPTPCLKCKCGKTRDKSTNKAKRVTTWAGRKSDKIDVSTVWPGFFLAPFFHCGRFVGVFVEDS